MKHSAKALEVLLKFFHDTYMLQNINGNPLLRDGEEIDIGQKAQSYANADIIMSRLTEAGVSMLDGDYKPIPNEKWEPGEVLVHVRTGKLAMAQSRKVFPHDSLLPGWWVSDLSGFPSGGIADIVHEWRSLNCVLAERRHYGLDERGEKS